MKWTPARVKRRLKTAKFYKWHKWFAWYPVCVVDKTTIGESSTVWLSPVMRRLKEGYMAPRLFFPDTTLFNYVTVDTFTADLLTGDRK